ncbi:MAG: twin-arginine translocase subunit TatC [Thermoguttaceae bacterium]
MPDSHEDDLFRESTMTFGEHLEELRGCLFKSALGLALGFALGLMIGGPVVGFIQRPLSRALTRYYQQESVERLENELAKDKQAGRTSPWTSQEMQDRVLKNDMLADEVYIDPREMLQELKKNYPDELKHVPPLTTKTSANADPTDSLIRLFLWHRNADDSRIRVKSLNAQEAFGVYVKGSLLVGVLLASPWIFFQIWNFVAAGLYPHERHYVHLYLPFSLGLFLLGASLAFFVVFEPVLNFLFSFNRSLGIDPDPRINEWLSFVLLLPVGFGLGFQLPLVMLFLERIGVFTIKNYLSQWRIAVLVIFALAALLTPPDPYSMLLMAVPLTFLYFGGILLCKTLPRHESPFQEGQPSSGQS